LYLILRLLIVIIISVFAQVIIIVFVKVFALNLVLQLFELESFTSVPINGARDKFLFNVFTKMVVEL
jgi:hypothetical protein